MRHDDTLKAMVTGLFDIALDFYRAHHAYTEVIMPWKHEYDRDSAERGCINQTAGVAKYTRRGAFIGLPPLRDTIKKYGWQDDVDGPLDEIPSDSIPAARWIGLTGEGMCPDCKAKPALEFVPEGNSYADQMQSWLDMFWQGYKVSMAYRRRQSDIAEDNGWIVADVAYQNYQAQLTAALECSSKAQHKFNVDYLMVSDDLTDALIRAGRPLDLPDIVEVGYERDFCPECRARVVEIDEGLA